MFTHHKTFIIALSISKQHIAIAPEMKTIEHFTQEIKEARYDYSPNLLRIRWKDDIPYELLKRMIEYNLADKANNIQFWR